MTTFMANRGQAPREPQFDVAESFDRALIRDRESRGEPVRGISRSAWEARRWMKRNPSRLARVGLILAAAGVGVGYAVYRSPHARGQPEKSEPGRAA